MIFKDGKRKALTLSYDDGVVHDITYNIWRLRRTS